MNRNTKHPDRAPHRRHPASGDRTRNSRTYRVTGSWDAHPDRPATSRTQDKAAARRTARSMAAQGAYVIVEEHRGHGDWRTLYELDGPAQVAQQAKAEQPPAERPLDVARLMAATPNARTDRRARHTAGARQ